MGLIAAQGELPAGYGVQVGSFTTQTDVQNTWADGSLRHALVSFNATSTGAKTLTAISNPGGTHTPTWPSATAVFVVTAGPGSGSTYTATLPSFTGTHSTANGAVARRAWTMVTPVTGGSTPHDLLQVFFEVTSYASGGHDVDITVQNVQNKSTINKVTYDLTLTANGSSFFTKSGHVHWTGTIYHKNSWVGATEAEVLHDFEPWRRSRVIPTIVAADAKVYNFATDNYQLGASATTEYFGEMGRAQGGAGTTERPDIQHVNRWDAQLFTLNTEHYRQASLKNGDMGGEWTWGIMETDGVSILKVTNPTYTNTQTEFSGTSGLANWPSDACYWPGARIGGCSESYANGIGTDVNNEHMPEMEMIPYLLTGKFFYLQTLRQHAAWAVMIANPGYAESDTRFFPGLYRGRNGTAGLVSSTGVTREFATPFKNVAHAAWAMPDGDADKSYFIAMTQNNLDYLGTYVRYWIDNNLGGDLEAFGGAEGGSGWQYSRGNTVVSTTSGNPTTLTVIGDNSGVGTGVNDHGAQTGDYVSLSGFVTTGATALNGTHVGPITRTGATTFTVPVNTSANTTSEGSYSFVTGFKSPPWRLAFTVYHADWAIRSGLFTISADTQEFVDRAVRFAIHLNEGLDDTEFFTNQHSGWAHGYYPSFGYVAGDSIVWFDNTLELQAANSHATSPLSGSSATARLYESQATYTGVSSTTHRGNTGWNDNEAEIGYSEHVDSLFVIGVRRGITGASTALSRQRLVTGHTADMSLHAGMYLDFDY